MVTRGRGERGTAGKPLDAGRATWREERGGSRKPLDAGSEAWRGERGTAGKPLNAGRATWRKERRQRETAGRRERGMEGGKQAAGKPLEAVGARGAQEQ